MMGKIVRRIVGSHQVGHVCAADHFARGEGTGERGIAMRPNSGGVLGIQNQIAIKIPAQLEMRPVRDRIARAALDRACECEKFFIWVAVSGNQFLRFAACAHEPPFVMVAAQPDLGKISKAPVLGDFRGA